MKKITENNTKPGLQAMLPSSVIAIKDKLPAPAINLKADDWKILEEITIEYDKKNRSERIKEGLRRAKARKIMEQENK